MEQKWRWIFFLSTMIGIMSLGLYYVYRKISPAILSKKYKQLLAVLLFLFLMYQISVPYFNRTLDLPVNHPAMLLMNWANYFGFGFFALLFFSLAILDGAAFLDRSPTRPLRRIFLHHTFPTGIFATTSILSGIGLWQARLGLRANLIKVPIENLPQNLIGLKIAQITDLHVGPTIQKGFVERVVNITNAHQPDIIAVTGDLVDGNVQHLQEQTAPLRNLKARYGVFYVTGNHEYYWGAPQWIDECVRLGMIPLLNEHRVVQIGNTQLVVAGVTDASQKDSDPRLALKNSPAGAIRVLLAHQPKTCDLAQKAGFHLQLSGHTHAGQFFPWSIFVRFAHKFYKGLNRLEQLWVYVGRGTGYWGPPIRLGVSPEVGILELTRPE